VLIPYRKYHASLVNGNIGTDSNQILFAFHEYLESKCLQPETGWISEYIDLDHFREEIEHGLNISSSIPQNKGLGSSGAICAVVYDRYKTKNISKPEHLREVFSSMESFFHRKSSGIDPLCIYYDSALTIENGEYSASMDYTLKTGSVNPFLIDTGIRSQTGPLVSKFMELMKNEKYASDFKSEYIPLVNKVVSQWKARCLNAESVMSISKAQHYYFNRMIPEEFTGIWESGIHEKLYALKICGSGGGGMLLGFTENIEETSDYLRTRFDINLEPV
jgi:mevalonate kinase